MDTKWNLTDSERTEKLVSIGANLNILHEIQNSLSPEAAERVADKLTTEKQKEKVFQGIHCVAAASSSSFAFEALIDMYLMSYKLNEDQKKTIGSLESEVKQLPWLPPPVTLGLPDVAAPQLPSHVGTGRSFPAEFQLHLLLPTDQIHRSTENAPEFLSV
ncbi:hypothetical protein CSIM01_06142 [Colletotrichum simmondsii]|uniref:Uncharacterized protein n=1 Tax=Colletotrichum simmondsii TaxID=703756 RepID=A0A135SN76_9PEZI|nr:hypothetical protein CSIM01_06142 [Colletotrichum simmondsii]